MTLMDRRRMMTRSVQSENMGWTAGVPYDAGWYVNPSYSHLRESEMLPAKGLKHILRGGTATYSFNKVVCYDRDGSQIGNALSVHTIFPGYFCLLEGTESIQVELNIRYGTTETNTLVIPVVLPTVPTANAALNTLYTAPVTRGVSVWNNTGAETANASHYTTDFVCCRGFSACRYRDHERSRVHFYTADKQSLNAGIIFQNTETFSIPEGAVYFRRTTTSKAYPIFEFTE